MGGSAGKTLFSEKVALTKDVQYDGVKNGPGWKLTTSNYFISKAPDLEHILQLIETQEDILVSAQSLSQICRTTTMPARISQLSSEIWSYMNLNLTGKALETFHNVPRHEGFEAWRRNLELVRARRSAQNCTQPVGAAPGPCCKALRCAAGPRGVGHQLPRVHRGRRARQVV